MGKIVGNKWTWRGYVEEEKAKKKKYICLANQTNERKTSKLRSHRRGEKKGKKTLATNEKRIRQRTTQFVREKKKEKFSKEENQIQQTKQEYTQKKYQDTKITA